MIYVLTDMLNVPTSSFSYIFHTLWINCFLFDGNGFTWLFLFGLDLLVDVICYLFQTIEALSSVPSPELALRLYLQCAEVCLEYTQKLLWCPICWPFVLLISSHFFFSVQAANDCDLEPVAYEFFTQAFILYEEEIAVINWNLNSIHGSIVDWFWNFFHAWNEIFNYFVLLSFLLYNG